MPRKIIDEDGVYSGESIIVYRSKAEYYADQRREINFSLRILWWIFTSVMLSVFFLTFLSFEVTIFVFIAFLVIFGIIYKTSNDKLRVYLQLFISGCYLLWSLAVIIGLIIYPLVFQSAKLLFVGILAIFLWSGYSGFNKNTTLFKREKR